MLFLALHTQAHSGNLALDTAPLLGDPTSEFNRHDAHILPGVQVCFCQRLCNVLHCIGGVVALLPLFADFEDPPTGGADVGVVHVARELIEFLTALLLSDGESQIAMLRQGGFGSLSLLLRGMAGDYLGKEYVKALEKMVEGLANGQGGAL